MYPTRLYDELVSYFSLLQVILMLVATLYNGVMYWVEERVWKAMRDMRREEIEGEDDLVKITNESLGALPSGEKILVVPTSTSESTSNEDSVKGAAPSSDPLGLFTLEAPPPPPPVPVMLQQRVDNHMMLFDDDDSGLPDHDVLLRVKLADDPFGEDNEVPLHHHQSDRILQNPIDADIDGALSTDVDLDLVHSILGEDVAGADLLLPAPAAMEEEAFDDGLDQLLDVLATGESMVLEADTRPLPDPRNRRDEPFVPKSFGGLHETAVDGDTAVTAILQARLGDVAISFSSSSSTSSSGDSLLDDLFAVNHRTRKAAQAAATASDDDDFDCL